MTKSLSDIDTTLNASSDDFIYFEPYGIGRSCGCVPPIQVSIVTGVPTFTFPLGGSYGCSSFKLQYTINGTTYTDDDVSGTDVYVTDIRIGYGQSCTGSATLICKNNDTRCKPAGEESRCSQTVNFSLKEGSGGSSGNPYSCGRNYGHVAVEVIQTGVARIIVADPSITFNEMQVTRCEVYHENQSIYGMDLDVGENIIQFPPGGDYWLKMYNPQECSRADAHFLRCILWGATGPKHVEYINNQH